MTEVPRFAIVVPMPNAAESVGAEIAR